MLSIGKSNPINYMFEKFEQIEIYDELFCSMTSPSIKQKTSSLTVLDWIKI